ncbi:MAG: hypothetical protein KIT31_14915 [Deltaproteobacteria bacterium]|nr:hypothetical protein [Deltaproteobacteria bacterium]
MKHLVLSAFVVVVGSGVARAEEVGPRPEVAPVDTSLRQLPVQPKPDPRVKVLVLPLPPSASVDAGLARTFDARLLVALEDTKRVVTVTADEEPECTTQRCLADLGASAGAAQVLSLTVVREAEGLTVFGTLIDAKTATVARRVELPRITPAALARNAPLELVPQLVAAPRTGPVVIGVSRPATPEAQTAALAISDRLTAMRLFRVASLDGSDRSAITHRAELVISDLSFGERRKAICTWREGSLSGTFNLVELATGKVVFTKTVSLFEERRAHFTSQSELADLLLSTAVQEWMTAFERSPVPGQLVRRR